MNKLDRALAKYVSMNGDADLDRISEISFVDNDPFHDYGDEGGCDIEGEIDIAYRYWTQDRTHDYFTIYTVGSEDLDKFLTFLVEFEG